MKMVLLPLDSNMNINHFQHQNNHCPLLLELVTNTQHEESINNEGVIFAANKNDDIITVGTTSPPGTADGGGGRPRTRGHWKPHEDAKLKELVALHGPHNWNLISLHLQGRSGKSCRLRWFNQLDPRLNKRLFTAEEEDRLTAAHKLYGNKWAVIARLYFPGRTDNAVKNHWHVIAARNRRQQRKQQIYSVNGSTVDAVTESTVDCQSQSNVDETASSYTILSLSAPFVNNNDNNNPMTDFQTLPTVNVTGSSTMVDQEGRRGVNGYAIIDGQTESSNSEVCASDSMANQTSHQGNQFNKITFFDFLGMGPT